jgi:hypothetical protein
MVHDRCSTLTEFSTALTTILPILFQYCCKYCYNDNRNLWIRNESGRFGAVESWFNPPFLWKYLYQVSVITVFTVFRLLTDCVCLYTYEFWFSLWKIVRSSVILLLPLFVNIHGKPSFSWFVFMCCFGTLCIYLETKNTSIYFYLPRLSHKINLSDCQLSTSLNTQNLWTVCLLS